MRYVKHQIVNSYHFLFFIKRKSSVATRLIGGMNMKRVLTAILIFLFCSCIAIGDASAKVRLFSAAFLGDFVNSRPNPFSSSLVELDPDTAAPIGLIGPIGNFVLDLVYDSTNDTLYGVAFDLTRAPFNGLIRIDITTGAGVPVGAVNWGIENELMMITSIAVDSSGQMFGWSQSAQSLVRINKNTGIVVEVYPHYLDTDQLPGLKFNNTDALYLFNGEGLFYRINTVTGEPAYTGD